MVVIGNLVTKMTLDTGGLKVGGREAVRDIDKLVGTLSGIKTAVTGFFALDAVRMGLDVVRGGISLFNDLRNEIDETSKAARRMGMATQDLRKFNMVADLSGVDNLPSAIERMAKGISEAAGGTGKAKDAIADLGLDAEKLRQMGPEKAVLAIADAMERIPNDVDRVRIAMKIFGNDGAEMLSLMEGGAANLRAQLESSGALLGNLTDEQAAQVERFNDTIERMGASLYGHVEIVAAEVARTFNANEKLMRAAGNAAFPGLGSLAADFFGLGEDLDKVAEGARRIAEMDARLHGSATNRLALAKQIAEQEERIAKAMEKGAGLQASISGQLDRLAYGERGAQIREWRAEAMAAGGKPDEVDRRVRQMELWGRLFDLVEAKRNRVLGDQKEAKALGESAETPAEKYLRRIGRLDDLRGKKLLTDEQYIRLARKAGKEADEDERAANPLIGKAEQMREAAESPLDRLGRQMRELDEMVAQKLFGGGDVTALVKRMRDRLFDEYAGSMGSPSGEAPTALLRGTAEAHNVAVRAGRPDEKEYLRKIAEEHLAELKAQNAQLKKIADRPEPKVMTVGR